MEFIGGTIGIVLGIYFSYFVFVKLPFGVLGLITAPEEGQAFRGSRYERIEGNTYYFSRKRKRINGKYEFLNE